MSVNSRHSIVHLLLALHNTDTNRPREPIVVTNTVTGDWNNVAVRRDFFDNFAASRAFNPLVVDNWYTISKKDILTKIVCSHASLFSPFSLPSFSLPSFYVIVNIVSRVDQQFFSIMDNRTYKH